MQKPKAEYISKADNSIIRPAALLAVIIAIMLILTLAFFIVAKLSGADAKKADDDQKTEDTEENTPTVNNNPYYQEISNFFPDYLSEEDGYKDLANAGLNSPNVALVDVSANKIIASSKSKTQIYPASLTKVMTLIVVFENLTSPEQLNEKITISEEVVTKMNEAQSTSYPLRTGDVLTVEELLYSVIMYSDGIACVTLAEYISGTEADFVKLMNAKATEMGLQNTNFKNCTGLHDKYHYSSCQDIAAIMMYAMKNPYCANIMTAQSFAFGSHFRPNDQYGPYTMYNQPLHEKKFTQPETIKVTAAKTGYTGPESGYCFVSYGKDKNGKAYILVTAGATSDEARRNDTITIYDTYTK